MLFISRYIGFDEFGVVDTDDGVETVLSQRGIIDAVNVPGIVIEGTKIHYNQGLNMSVTSEVRPYQPVDTMSLVQTKMSMLRNIDVTVYGSMITSIFIRYEKIKEPVSVRLSDFGDVCADLVLRGNKKFPRRHVLTLILDDKIQLRDLSFIILPYADKRASVGVSGLGVVFDVRDVKTEETVERVYRAVWNGNHSEFRSSILDDQDRKRKMIRAVKRWSKVAKV